jgi:hypothetical protein
MPIGRAVICSHGTYKNSCVKCKQNDTVVTQLSNEELIDLVAKATAELDRRMLEELKHG